MSPFDLKDYEPVEDRLRAFWSEFPEGRVWTDLVEHTDGTYVVKAEIYSDRFEVAPVATGYATETVTDRGVNATSALENCETSAIGRALANLGYAAKGKRPSREEMSKSAPTQAGADAGVRVDTTSSDSGHASAEGEAAGGPDPGGAPGGDSLPPARASRYPENASTCTHKARSGRWLRWLVVEGTEVCPRCGTPKLVAIEGTNVDLGAAS